MDVRDPDLVEAWTRTPYAGYALHKPAPDYGRIAACVAILGTMVGGGVLLGRPRT